MVVLDIAQIRRYREFSQTRYDPKLKEYVYIYTDGDIELAWEDAVMFLGTDATDYCTLDDKQYLLNNLTMHNCVEFYNAAQGKNTNPIKQLKAEKVDVVMFDLPMYMSHWGYSLSSTAYGRKVENWLKNNMSGGITLGTGGVAGYDWDDGGGYY